VFAYGEGIAAGAEQQKRVLVMYSTRRDAQIVNIGERDLPALLEAVPGRLDYYSEYIDLPRFSDAVDVKAFRDFLLLKYRDTHFDAVIAVDTAALELVTDLRGQLFSGTPIVFFTSSSLTGSIENATGLVANLTFTDTLALIGDLQPQVRHIFVVTGAAPGDLEYEQVARQQFRAFETRFAIHYLNGLPSAELESRVSSLPAGSAIYYLLVSRDGGGQNVHPLNYLSHLTAIANAPVYCWVDSAIDHGIVGGSLKDQTVQLDALGRLALRVLSGESAASIPVSSPNLNVREVDWRQLRRWHISESRVPPGTRVLFKQPSVWDRYRLYILGIVAVVITQTLLIAGLLLQRQMRRQAEAQARGSEQELHGSYLRIRDLAARLLHAQDTERSRIARELHDDISQQVALLSMNLELLLDKVPPDMESLVGDTLNQAQDITRNVHDLSHRLHPTRLRLTGLVAALETLQRELSRSGPEIVFTHGRVPEHLPSDLTLSLFRVVQEALQNAIKYSRARTVTVDLHSESDALVLTISDDGVGFNVDAAVAGLGLISMNERIDAVGGTFAIQSRHGRGTRIAIRVPLVVQPATASNPARQAG
jgi:signal transduction histidine kinase